MEGPLNLESRKRIYDVILARPGTYLREMERELGMQVGVLSYHLRVLMEAGMVRAEPEGNQLRYFPAEGFIMNDRKALSYLRNRSTRTILLYALDRGSITFQELMEVTNVSKSTLSYHLKRLSIIGLLKVSKEGGTTVQVADPERLINLLVWIREDVEGDAAEGLIEIWTRLGAR